jgi:hypothetical protein
MKQLICVPKWFDAERNEMVYEFGTEHELLGALSLETICAIYGHSYKIVVVALNDTIKVA